MIAFDDEGKGHKLQESEGYGPKIAQPDNITGTARLTTLHSDLNL